MPSYGTMSLADLLAQTSGTVAQIGEDNVWAAFEMSLEAHNRQMLDMVSAFVRFVDDGDRLIGTGALGQGDFEEMAEFETPRPQRFAPGENLGIPKRKYAFGQQWTEEYLSEATPADLAGQFVGVMQADKRNIILQINRAIYPATNYTSVDILKKDNASLPVKRLANADSFAIPPGPNGETFDSSTHTHYIARVSTFAASDLDALILTVQQHYIGGVRVAINSAQEAAVRAFTGFTATVDARIVQANTVTYARTALDTTNQGDRFIGVYNGAEIWVKPWAIANYLVAWNMGAPKALAYRTTSGADAPSAGLQPIYRQRGYPLTMEGWQRVFGIGVVGRVSMAILYVGGTSYTAPTLVNAP